MARKASTFSVSNIVAKRKADLAAARQELTALKEHAAEFRAALHVINMVADHADKIGFTKWTSVSLYTSSYPEIFASLEGYVDSLKEGAIVEILERAMACGFEASSSKDFVNDWASQRSFTLKHSIAGVKIDLKITANISETNPTCRKVQTGTKLQEVATYAIVCE